jgi:group I intron endonuclease
MEGLEELHNNVMFYLAIVLFTVTWMAFTVIISFRHNITPISHKYMNHGTHVPIKKYCKSNYTFFKNKICISLCTYTTLSNNCSNNINYIKKYENAYYMRKDILLENIDKSGIYMLTNKLTNDIYIGQSIDISKRFKNYFNLSYIKSKDNYIISRALIKYGYTNFSLTILEYCDKSNLFAREQNYLDKLNPQYNILKTAGSYKKFKHSEKTKIKISKSLKGIYIGDKSALFGRHHTDETKNLMSLRKAKNNNPLFGKIHSKYTKELMRKKALNRKHSEETK